MGRTLIACGLLMAAAIALLGWLQPGSFVMWFAASEGQMATVRWAIVGVLAGLLVADMLTDSRLLRWLAGVLSLVLAYDASRVLLENAVYMLDFLIVAMAAVCSAIVALQPQATERRALPSAPRVIGVSRAPVRRPLVGLFDRLSQPRGQRRRSVPDFMRMSRDQDIEDNRHRLMISYRA